MNLRIAAIAAALACLVACPTAEPDPDPGPEPVMRATLQGEMTWQVDFDGVAEEAGAVDCSYTRGYDGVEDRSSPWKCVDCDVVYRADVEMLSGLGDCFSQVTVADVNPLEHLGFGGGSYYRGVGSAMTLQGTFERDGDAITTRHVIPGVEAMMGGTLTFTIDGSFTEGSEEGDPSGGFEPPESYSCGWPSSDRPPYDGDWVAEIGGVMPDGVFHDVCEEPVRLHDFAGRYLLVDVSAMDCPPCRSMAQAEGAFVEELAGEGIEVEVITLLAPSLSDTAGTPTTEQLQTWIDDFDLHSPVLADRGWGLGVVEPMVGDDYGYPTTLVVDPDLVVLDVVVGFGSFDGFAEIIRADAAR